jgi:hypothetical protein
MAIDFREKFALQIPRDSQLVFAITSQASKVQATAFLNLDGTTNDIRFAHQKLWNKTPSVELPAGRHIAEVDLDFHAAEPETVDATLRILDRKGELLREWTEEFVLTAPLMGVAQYLISVK